MLKDAAPGTFVVRDSNSFPGAFGLALKVATPPPGAPSSPRDPSSELVRHFLIEPTSRGVRLKGCANEPVFSSLSALVYQHSLMAMALPCPLLLPEPEAAARALDSPGTNSTQQLLAQGAGKSRSERNRRIDPLLGCFFPFSLSLSFNIVINIIAIEFPCSLIVFSSSLQCFVPVHHGHGIVDRASSHQEGSDDHVRAKTVARRDYSSFQSFHPRDHPDG